MVCGVAMGLAERYGLSAVVIRTLFVAAFVVSPIAALVYVLLSISMPSEVSVAGQLRLISPEMNLAPRERFERFSQLLLQRLLGKQSKHTVPAHTAAIGLLVFAALLELPRVEGITFYRMHPLVATLLNDISKVGTALFYLSIAIAFLFQWKQSYPIAAIINPVREKFIRDRGAQKMIGGVASGLSQVLELDPAYLRVLLIVLNILTMGLTGAAYLLVWYFQLEKDGMTVTLPPKTSNSSARTHSAFRIVLAVSFILLAAIRIATEFRLFFFNESFFTGLAMALVGIALVWNGLGALQGRIKIWIVGGACVFFLGVGELTSAVAHIQLTTPERFEIAEIILALSMAYLGVVALHGYARRLGLIFSLVFAVAAMLIAVHFVPPGYLMELIRFYDFFYPILFAGLGLWIAFER